MAFTAATEVQVYEAYKAAHKLVLALQQYVQGDASTVKGVVAHLTPAEIEALIDDNIAASTAAKGSGSGE